MKQQKQLLYFFIITFTFLGIFITPQSIYAAYNEVSPETTVQINETSTSESKETTTNPFEIPTPDSEETTTKSSENPTTKPSDSAKDFIKSTLSPIKSKIIVLDPGHCGKHSGTSRNNLKEEVIVTDIANACKKQFDKYGDVTVYMTRSDLSCCKSLASGNCLNARSRYAKLLSANFLVSMHINDGGGSGAYVITPYKSGYHNSTRKKAKKLALNILSELEQLGLANKGLILRKSSNGTRYPNGKLADYYSLIKAGIKNKIPSIIIEHGFISNSNDRKFFKKKSKRKKLGKADAKAIISYYNLSKKVIKGSFVKEGKNTYYVTKKSKKVTGWVKSDGKWYYFDETTGIMQKGFVTIGKNTFYFKPSTGHMVSGWFKVKGARYLCKGNGVLVKNQAYSDGKHTYLFDESGKRIMKGRHKINGKRYYVNPKTGYVQKK